MSDFSDYNDYWEKRGKIEHPMRRWAIAAGCLPERATLLDVGCGSGEFLEFVRKKKPMVTGKGVDFSLKSVEMTQASGFDAELLDLATDEIRGQYDFVTCFEVLEHIPEAEVALRHLKAAFRKQLIISVPNIGYLGCRLRLALFGRFPTTNCIMHIKEHVRHWTPKDFCEWVSQEGLQVVRIEGQYGSELVPWKKLPFLFARGLVYVIEHADGSK